MTGKKTGGRPKSELDLPKGWKREILYMYERGATDEQVKARIYKWRSSFSNNLWYRWLEEKGEFWETIEKGKILARAFFDKFCLENFKTPAHKERLNTGLIHLYARNRGFWDKDGYGNDNKEVKIVVERTILNRDLKE